MRWWIRFGTSHTTTKHKSSHMNYDKLGWFNHLWPLGTFRAVSLEVYEPRILVESTTTQTHNHRIDWEQGGYKILPSFKLNCKSCKDTKYGRKLEVCKPHFLVKFNLTQTHNHRIDWEHGRCKNLPSSSHGLYAN